MNNQPEDIKEDFPSLYKYVEWGDFKTEESTDSAWFVWYPMVARYTIDKERVKEAIDEAFSYGSRDSRYEIKNNLLKILGLEVD